MAVYTEYPTEQKIDFFTTVGNAFHLIKRSWEAVRLNLGTFILVYLIPSLVLMGVVSVASGSKSIDGADALLLSIGMIGAALLYILLTIASIVVQLASVRGKKINFSEALNQSLPFFWRIVGLGILSILAVIVGLILLVIPGILAMFFLLLASYVLIDQKVGVVEAMKKSYEITKANWKAVLALIFVQFVISLPAVIPYLGRVITFILAIAYFCLPAIIYLRAAGKGKEVVEVAPAE